MRRITAFGVMLLGLVASIASFAQADELDGAWATEPSACDKIFVQKQKRISVASNSDAYGNGFIIEGDRIRGKVSNCRITHRKREGKLLTLIASCSSDIALSTVQFTLRLDGENVVTRLFPGMEGLEASYSRCPANR